MENAARETLGGQSLTVLNPAPFNVHSVANTASLRKPYTAGRQNGSVTQYTFAVYKCRNTLFYCASYPFAVSRPVDTVVKPYTAVPDTVIFHLWRIVENPEQLITYAKSEVYYRPLHYRGRINRSPSS